MTSTVDYTSGNLENPGIIYVDAHGTLTIRMREVPRRTSVKRLSQRRMYFEQALNLRRHNFGKSAIG